MQDLRTRKPLASGAVGTRGHTRRSAMPHVVFVLGLVAWVAAFITAVGVQGGDTADQFSRLAVAIVLAVVGTGLVIVASIHDVASRD